MGGQPKAAMMLAGRPLIGWPLAALAEACDAVAVVAKGSTELPPLPDGAQCWTEPDEPRHPLTGIVCALERARGPVLVCAADMPFVTGAVLRALVIEGDEHAVVAATKERIEPLLALYRPSALELLRATPAGGRLTAAVDGLAPSRVSVPAAVARSVNTPEQLRAAEAELSA